MSTPLGLVAKKQDPPPQLTPEQLAERIKQLRKVLNARLDNKSARNEGNMQCLRRMLKFGDLEAKGTLTYEQWCASFERLGAQLAPVDLDLLFATFATPESDPPQVNWAHFSEAMCSGEQLGPLSGQDFVTAMSERHGERPREGKRTYDDVLFNKPPPYALGDFEELKPRRIVEKSTNTPSVPGGIFAPAPPIRAPDVPSRKNESTLNLKHHEFKPSESPSPGATTKFRQSNTSSVPGGIFAEGNPNDFRVRGGLFVRPGY